MNPIRIEGVAVLLCPACGGDYLHQRDVRVYQRDGEDSPTGVRAEVSNRAVTAANRVGWDDGNPSERRDGLCVVFDCEFCPAISVLKIAQNKGNTFLSMPHQNEPGGPR